MKGCCRASFKVFVFIEEKNRSHSKKNGRSTVKSISVPSSYDADKFFLLTEGRIFLRDFADSPPGQFGGTIHWQLLADEFSFKKIIETFP